MTTTCGHSNAGRNVLAGLRMRCYALVAWSTTGASMVTAYRLAEHRKAVSDDTYTSIEPSKC